MSSLTDVIDELEEAGLRDKVKVMIGGVPVGQEYVDKIKADGFAHDGNSFVRKAIELLESEDTAK